MPSNLFEILPFHDDGEENPSEIPSREEMEETQLHPYAIVPFNPSISHQLKRALGKAAARLFSSQEKTTKHPVSKIRLNLGKEGDL
jgi:hypothetical protein